MRVFTVLSALSAAALTMAAPGRQQKRSTREHSTNWSGAVIEGSNITGITATFTVLDTMKPTVSEQGKDAYIATAWVGIDGENATDECPGLWQAGVQSENANYGGVSFMVWYELYPLSPVFLDLGNITTGDVIKVALSTPTANVASVVMENVSKGVSYNTTTNITQPLCFRSAEWVIERTYTLSELAGLLDFGNASFTDISYTQAGEVITTLPDNVIIKDIYDDELNNTQQTHTEITDSTIQVTYLG